MGLTANVVDGALILPPWGNEIRDRTLQVFQTVAERDAGWTSPPNGARCITLDTYTVWQRQAGVWRLPANMAVHASSLTITDYYTTIPGYKDVFAVPAAQPMTFPYPTTVLVITNLYMGNASGVVQGSADLVRYSNGAVVASSPAPCAASAATWVPLPINVTYSVAANTDVCVKGRANITGVTGTCHFGGTASVLIFSA